MKQNGNTKNAFFPIPPPSGTGAGARVISTYSIGVYVENNNMNEKLRELRSKCSEKEAKFLELWVNGQDKFNAYNNAGFKAKSTKVASAALCRLLKKVNCSAYLEALKNERDSELQRKSKITRTTQLNALEGARKLAEKLNKPSAMVAAIKEQNEMMGFHREPAENPEKEKQRRKHTKQQTELIRKVAAELTKTETKEREDTEPPCKVVKLTSA